MKSSYTSAVAVDDAVAVQSGILAIRVCTDREREKYRVTIPDTAAARCVEREDGIHWSDGKVYWSNRSRTVRDIPLGKVLSISKDTE